MNKTIILYRSYRPVDNPDFFHVLKQLHSMGALIVSAQGIPDVALATNVGLTLADSAPPERDTIFMVDDDMVFVASQASQLVQESRDNSKAVTAQYARQDGRVVTEGLGFIAIPRRLLTYKDTVHVEGQPIKVFCNSGPHFEFNSPGASKVYWRGEDEALLERIGGRIVSNIVVGHRKTVTLWPKTPITPTPPEGKSA